MITDRDIRKMEFFSNPQKATVITAQADRVPEVHKGQYLRLKMDAGPFSSDEYYEVLFSRRVSKGTPRKPIPEGHIRLYLRLRVVSPQ